MKISVFVFSLCLTLFTCPAKADTDQGKDAFHAAAFAESKALADLGNGTAQSRLGVMYFYGRGVPKDYAEAVKWFRLAADQGEAEAQIGLGKAYEEGGHGVVQDYTEAAKWYRLAADQGNASAKNYLGVMYDKGQGVPPDQVEAVKWYGLAADQGDVFAISNLADKYRNGQGVQSNPVVSWALYCLLMNSRNVSGTIRANVVITRATLIERISVKEIDTAQALAREISKPGNLLKAIDRYINESLIHESQYVATRDFCTAIKLKFDGIDKSEPQNLVERIEKKTREGNLDAQVGLASMKLCGIVLEKSVKQGINLLRAAAEQEHVVAQILLHDAYLLGIGVMKDEPEAIKWLQRAATNGNAEAQLALGIRFVAGEGSDKDLTEAKRWLSKSAVQGNPYAQTMLGAVYLDEMSFTEALNWLRQAAALRNARAQYLLGLMYERSQGVQRDLKEAIRLTRLAAEQGLPEAKESLTHLYAEEEIAEKARALVQTQNHLDLAHDGNQYLPAGPLDAVKQFQLAADRSAVAQNNLGIARYLGQGIQIDYQEALRLFRLAAVQGSALALNNLAVAYFSGRGVPKDYDKAAKLLRLAADQGNAIAQHNLGWVYVDAMGVPQDFEEAAKWYRLAADQGYAKAQIEIGDAYAGGRGVSQSWEKALDWYWRAANQGNAKAKDILEWTYRGRAVNGYIPAQFQLGLMYATGFCVKKNPIIAYALYDRAVAACSRTVESGEILSDSYGESCKKSSIEKALLTGRMTPGEIKAAEVLVQEIAKAPHWFGPIEKMDEKPPGCLTN